MKMLSTLLAVSSSSSMDGLLSSGFGIFFICFYCVFILFWLVAIGLWIWMLIDLVQRDESEFGSTSGNQKVLWLLIVLLTGWIGSLIYYFMIYRKFPRSK